MPMISRAFALSVAAALLLAAAPRSERYLVWLADPPAAAVAAKNDLPAARRAVAAAQDPIRRAIEDRGARVYGSSDTLLNALFVTATGEEARQLAGVPGVLAVQRMSPIRRHLNRALDLMNATAAWNNLGGQGNAGAGTRIAILDTGIDHNHPMMRDPALTPPAGFPRGDAAFTNSKVIVARSYVEIVARFGGRLEDFRPDDLSPRDRVGKGTALASLAAGAPADSPFGRVSGIAPKAWLGNYKIFGSPGVNDETYIDAVLQALSDAALDGMDVALLSFGTNPASWTLSDTGNVCGRPAGSPCDPFAAAVENAARAGLTVVTSAGNDGDFGVRFPALNSINSPGSAPAAITVGATTNSHLVFQTVRTSAPNPPAELNPGYGLFGDGPVPAAPLTRRLRAAPGDGRACAALPAGSLAGSIALIERGDCLFFTKVANAAAAGADAVIIYRTGDSSFPIRLTGLATTAIPAFSTGGPAGRALRALAAGDVQVTLNPALAEVTGVEFDTVAAFSSRGPNINALELKPELAAVGTDLVFATQTYDPNGDLWSATGWATGQGTSFAAAFAAGAAALVKQRNPRFTPAQVKSALANTASDAVDDFDEAGVRSRARVTAIGGGKLDLGRAVQTNVTVEPATLSFGRVTAVPVTRTLRVTNTSSGALNLSLGVSRRDPDARGQLALSSSSVSLGAGQSAEITVRLQGSVPAAGSYEGAITITGGAVPLRVPFLYLVSDNQPFNLLSIYPLPFVNDQGRQQRIGLKVTDRYGLPVANAATRFTPSDGIDRATPNSDALGISEAFSRPFPGTGEYSFRAEAGSLSLFFDGRVRPAPAIAAGGVVNAASFEPGAGLAPGSYLSIFGTALSEAQRFFATPYLPVSLAGVSVSFDDTARGVSVPGRLHFVRPDQVNVQIPWELTGSRSAQLKVSIGASQSALVTIPIAAVSPGFFEFQDGANRVAAARDEANAVVTAANPVQRGRVIQFFLNGLGAVDQTLVSGEVTPGDRLTRTVAQPVVTIGGQPAAVQFSGMTPFNVGLYQVNVVVPAGSGTGLQPVTLSINGVAAKPTQISVR
jgi:uncharacterized protein (TIGR03437 family)